MDRCAWPRKVESKISRSSCCKISGQKAMVINNVNYILDSISQANNYTCKVEDDRDFGQNGGAARRMKIVVKKQDLKQILDVLMREAAAGSNYKSTRNGHVPPPTTTLEQRLNLMRKRQLLRKASQVVKLRNNAAAASWRPALHSIPEEEI